MCRLRDPALIGEFLDNGHEQAITLNILINIL